MPNVAVDIGNTRIKAALFEGEQLIATSIHSSLEDLLISYASGTYHWIFSSVRADAAELHQLFAAEKYVVLTDKMRLPIEVNYDTPDTLGMDRLAAAVGAAVSCPNHHVLVIDAGTCMTYDLVDKEGTFQGGIIAPGLKMRMQAMSHFTEALPDIHQDFSQIMLKNLGKSTRECLLAGSLSASIHEMNGFVDSFLKEYDELVVMMTGGDAIYFESKLKAPIFANFDLVLIGLNRILIYNQ